MDGWWAKLGGGAARGAAGLAGWACAAGRRMGGAVAGVVYPGRCMGCGAFHELGGCLCAECEGELDRLGSEPACARCGEPLGYEAAPCPWCLGKGLGPLDRVVRLGIYRGRLRELIHRMKYEGQWHLAELLAGRLADAPGAREVLGRAAWLAPVPLHWVRQVMRGYNQSAVLAGALAGLCGVRVADPLRRIRDTQPQVRLASRQARRQNVKGAFALRRWGVDRLKGMHVVLVDDVITTGATIQEVARQLRRLRPASISAVVLAMADPRGAGVRVSG